MSKRLVSELILKFNIPVEDWLAKYYYKDGCNLATASNILGIPKGTLWAWMKRNGFKTKSQSESQSGELNGFYGKKHNKGSKNKIGKSSSERVKNFKRGRYGRFFDDGKHPSGYLNPTFKTGISSYRKLVPEKIKNGCQKCGSHDKIEVHHIDRNRKNNSSNNLVALCSVCHRREHDMPRDAKGRFLKGGGANA